jgi:enoyl-CoA hydratase/carnithine racemase
MLLRSTPITAEEACRLGMVNRVVAVDQLRPEAMSWARDIASLNPAMAALIKRGINGALDTQGFSASLAHGFDLQELGYAFAAAARSGSPDGHERPGLLERMRATNAEIARREESERDGARRG